MKDIFKVTLFNYIDRIFKPEVGAWKTDTTYYCIHKATQSEITKCYLLHTFTFLN